MRIARLYCGIRIGSVIAAVIAVLLSLFAGVARASNKSVVEEKVVPEALTVDVHAHSLETQSGPLPVWTFVSKGLVPVPPLHPPHEFEGVPMDAPSSRR